MNHRTAIHNGFSSDDYFCLITGASSGIGYSIAEELAGRKRNLVLVALPNTGLEEISHNLHTKYGVSVLSISTDLTEPLAARNIYYSCVKYNIQINVLINNAGFGNLVSFQDSELDELLNMMTLNNQSLVMLTHQFLPMLSHSAPAYILNTGSLASFFKIPYKAVYSATKSFVYSFSAALRLELEKEKIYVSCLCPGGTLTSQRFKETLSKSNGNGGRYLQLPQAVAIAAVDGLFARKFRIVPGIHNKVMLFLNDLLPEFIVNWFLLSHFKPKKLKPLTSLG